MLAMNTVVIGASDDHVSTTLSFFSSLGLRICRWHGNVNFVSFESCGDDGPVNGGVCDDFK